MFKVEKTLAEELAIVAQELISKDLEAQERWEEEEERFQEECARSRHLASVRSEAENWVRWEIFKSELKPQGLTSYDISPSHRARIESAGERAVEQEEAKEVWLHPVEAEISFDASMRRRIRF